jgi:hypothetical protein
MPDVLEYLTAADPARGFAAEPDAARRHAVVERARRGAVAAPSPPRRAVSPRLGALAGVGLAGVGAAVLVLTGGPEAHPSDAQAAVVRAAQALPDATQGLVVLDYAAVSDGTVLRSSHEELRFHGTAVAATGSQGGTQQPDRALPEARFVGGNLYLKGIRSSVPGWGRLVGAPAAGPTSPSALIPGWTKATDPEAAVALVSALTDVREDDSAQGVTTYRGTVTVDALERTYGAGDPSAVAVLTAGAEQDLGPIAVTAQVSRATGRLQTLAITQRRAPETVTSTVDYTGLAQPQDIAAPVGATDITGEE